MRGWGSFKGQIEPSTAALDWPGLVAMGADIVVALAAVGAVVVGLRGLKTWQTQLRGTAEFELARSLRKYIFELRDELKSIRADKFFIGGEPDDAATEPFEKRLFETMSFEQKLFHLSVQQFEKRWEAVADMKHNIESLLIEADAFWGHEILDKYKPIAEQQEDLYRAKMLYFRMSSPNITQQQREEAEREFRENYGAGFFQRDSTLNKYYPEDFDSKLHENTWRLGYYLQRRI